MAKNNDKDKEVQPETQETPEVSAGAILETTTVNEAVEAVKDAVAIKPGNVLLIHNGNRGAGTQIKERMAAHYKGIAGWEIEYPAKKK